MLFPSPPTICLTAVANEWHAAEMSRLLLHATVRCRLPVLDEAGLFDRLHSANVESFSFRGGRGGVCGYLTGQQDGVCNGKLFWGQSDLQ